MVPTQLDTTYSSQQPVLFLNYHIDTLLEIPKISYDNSETSGFYSCCVPFEICDANISRNSSWNLMDKNTIAAYPESGDFYVDYSNECGGNPFAVTGIAYLWEDIPTRRSLGAPIYSDDEYRLPATPWKYDIA